MWRFDGRQFSNFNKTNGLPGNWIQSITEAPDGTLWFTTGQTRVESAQGVVRYDGKQFTTFAATNGLAENYVRVIYCDRDGTVWLGSGSSGLSRFHPSAEQKGEKPFETFTQAKVQTSRRVPNIGSTTFNGPKAFARRLN